MRRKLPLLITGISVLFLSNCRHALKDIPLPAVIESPVSKSAFPDNVIDSVCFSDQILPILTSNCSQLGCHDNTTAQAGINLSSYSNLKASISGNLLMQVIQDSGPLGMPPILSGNPKLTSTQINIIKTWVNQGMKNGIDCMGPCDTSHVTFSATILPIVQDACLGCHSNIQPILLTYDQIKFQVDSGKFYCVINHLAGCPPMPENSPQLSACKLLQINKWINAGAPNN